MRKRTKRGATRTRARRGLSARAGARSGAGVDCRGLQGVEGPPYRLAESLLRRLLAIARQGGADTAFLEVRRSNRAAIHLYQSEGFCETGLRRGYYPASQGREDAILMAMPLLP